MDPLVGEVRVKRTIGEIGHVILALQNEVEGITGVGSPVSPC